MDAPSPARVYDALLGGSHNFEIDRMVAERAARNVPDLPASAAANRRFLHRAVTYLATEAGVRQFVDLGAGIPTVGNTHEILHAVAPDSSVVYVDIDAVAVAHATAILDGNDRAVAIRGDMRDPEGVLEAAAATGLLDLDRPVGLLLVALLHLIPDSDRPGEVMSTLLDALPAGSHVVISHLTRDDRPDEAKRLSSDAARKDGISLVFRSRAEIEAFFGGFELVPPGLVATSAWRPDEAEAEAGRSGGTLWFAGVGRKG